MLTEQEKIDKPWYVKHIPDDDAYPYTIQCEGLPSHDDRVEMFKNRMVAEHIVEAHNQWLDQKNKPVDDLAVSTQDTMEYLNRRLLKAQVEQAELRVLEMKRDLIRPQRRTATDAETTETYDAYPQPSSPSTATPTSPELSDVLTGLDQRLTSLTYWMQAVMLRVLWNTMPFNQRMLIIKDLKVPGPTFTEGMSDYTLYFHLRDTTNANIDRNRHPRSA